MGLFDFLRDLFNPVKPPGGPSRGLPESTNKRVPAEQPSRRTELRRARKRVGFFASKLALDHLIFEHPLFRPGKRTAGPPPKGLPELARTEDLASALGIGFARLKWLTRGSAKHYHERVIPKASGKARLIEAPKRDLKRIQRWILRNILERIEATPHAHGFVKGRSTMTNAAPHVGRRVIVKLDLKDYFWQFRIRRVAGLFKWAGYKPWVAWALAKLCCHKGRLPQGAPSSPALTNAMCRRLDRRLAGIANRSKAVYTRYADDITLSFETRRDPSNLFMTCFRKILMDEGFHLAKEKTRFARRGSRQTVTGIVVNEKLSPPRDEVRNLRALLHDARLHGAVAANREGLTNFGAVVRGRIEAVRAIDRAKGEKLLAEYRRVAWG